MMKPLLPVAAILLVACERAPSPSPPLPPSPWEGEVHTVLYSQGGVAPVRQVLMVRGTLRRFAFSANPDDPVYVLWDWKTGRETIVDPARRTCDVPQPAWDSPFGYLDTAFRKVVLTDRRETIAGLECRIVVFEQTNGATREVCITTALGEVGGLGLIEYLGSPPKGGTSDGRPAEGLDAYRAEFGERAFELRSASILDGERFLEFEVESAVPNPMPPELFVTWGQVSHCVIPGDAETADPLAGRPPR